MTLKEVKIKIKNLKMKNNLELRIKINPLLAKLERKGNRYINWNQSKNEVDF